MRRGNPAIFPPGQVAERLKAAVLKTVGSSATAATYLIELRVQNTYNSERDLTTAPGRFMTDR